MGKRKKDLYVVGIGASAGGLKALQDLFDAIPNNTGMAFVIVQHLSPDFKSLMPELLSKHTCMPIHTAKDKQSLKPNTIYLNQNNKNLHIKESKIYLLNKGPKHNLNLPIDILFHTLGEEFKERSIAVILSGTGSDGSRGITTIKEGGGTIMVQDPNDAQFDGMPISAINTNTVDYIDTVPGIARVLSNKLNILPVIATTIDSGNNKIETYIKKILVDVYKYSGIDFRQYKKNTLLRRIEKRMSLNNMNIISDYAQLVEKNDTEKHALKDSFLIGVTRFFRDDEAFDTIKKTVIPSIVESKKNGDTIRIWIAGCSTGEEVYSIAILFNEYIETKKKDIDFKIFATDIDPRGLSVAGLGAYDVHITNEIEENYITKYFFKNGEQLQIIKQIREKIVFSQQNLINDPPFINIDLISCRNLLIYLDTSVQRKVMQNFQFSLNIFGYLFLGNSESLGNVASHFKTINTNWKIFQNIEESKYSPNLTKPFTKFQSTAHFSSRTASSLKLSAPNNTVEAYPFDRYLSRRFSPDAVFIDHKFNILFIAGDVGNKLHHGQGVFQNNLLKIVDQDIVHLLKNGLRRLKKSKADVVIKNVINRSKNGDYKFNLKFHRPENEERFKEFYLIEFSQETAVDTPSEELEVSNISANEDSKEYINDLEYELNVLKVDLQNAIEELETTNEELQSSNEELMASNEELQSTNEELQSVNEELYTVNSEMQEKNKELTNLSNDVINLLNNTEIATLFLDPYMCIRKFTPAIKDIFNLQNEDIGRKLSTFTSNFDQKTTKKLIADSQTALSKLVSIENQLRDTAGNYYLHRVSPFITSNKTIDGVVITLNNINKIKQVEENLKEEELKYLNLFENLSEAFIHCKIITNNKGESIDWEYLHVNPAYEKLVGLTAEDLVGKRASDILPELIDDPNKWIQKYGITALEGKNQTIEGYVACLDKHLYVNTFSPKQGEFAGTISDFTELKHQEKALIKSEYELNNVQRITHVGSWNFDIATGQVDWTKELYRIYKLDPTKLAPSYETHSKLYQSKSWELLSKAVAKTQKDGTPYDLELQIIKSDGEQGWLRAKGEAVKENGKIVSLRGSAQDITAFKESELALTKSEYELRNVQRLTNVGSWTLDIDSGDLTWTEELFNMFQLDASKRAPHINDHAKLFTENSWRRLSNLIKIAQVKGKPYEVELEFIRPNGDRGWCIAHGEAVKVDNKIVTLRGSVQDITKIKENEQALIYAKTEAEKSEQANKYKNFFLANMSHEIRTPISSVLGFADLLRNDQLLKSERLKYIEIIDSNSKQLLNLINDIIDISKIESGELKITYDECNLSQLLENLTLTFEQIKIQKNKSHITLKPVIPKNLKNLTITTDTNRLEQVLSNLINNALKFSEKGTITYGFKKVGDYISFFVEDEGIGIAKHKQKEIFDSFKQINYNTKNNTGTGLGLAICKAIVSLLGGNISVESKRYKGSTFKFNIPFKSSESIENKSNKIKNRKDQFLKDKTILIAEDNTLIRMLLNAILTKTGAELKFAENGKIALDYFKENPNFDLVLLDIRMPKMSGIEALESILEINPDTKIVMQTAHAMENEKSLCFEKGCVDFLSKPIIKENLYATLEKWIN